MGCNFKERLHDDVVKFIKAMKRQPENKQNKGSQQWTCHFPITA